MGRHFKHHYDDSKYPPDILPATKKLLAKWLPMMQSQAESGSIYSGLGGTAYLLYRIGCHPLEGDGFNHFEDALEVLRAAEPLVSHRRSTFLEGPIGLKALEIAVRSKLTMPIDDLLDTLLARLPQFKSPDECELLYGRAGCLQAILFLRKELARPQLGEAAAEQIALEIVHAGNVHSHRKLVWKWHDKDYFGAAHGSAGILLILSHFLPSGSLIEALDGCMQLQFPSGNIPSSAGNDSDRLVHWCHGSPGWVVPTLRLAPEKAAALGAVVWERGIVHTKGLGLCHGVCGNAYALLALYQYTRDELWLRRALHFATYAVEEWDRLAQQADRPLSLFEGVGGALSLLLDLRKPDNATLCGYYLH